MPQIVNYGGRGISRAAQDFIRKHLPLTFIKIIDNKVPYYIDVRSVDPKLLNGRYLVMEVQEGPVVVMEDSDRVVKTFKLGAGILTKQEFEKIASLRSSAEGERKSAGASDEVAQLKAELEKERTAHAATKKELEKVNAELAKLRDVLTSDIYAD